MTQEKRKYMRFNTSIGLTYKMPERNLEGFSHVENASKEGLKLSMDKALEKGNILELELAVWG